jgi:hypothetical protein
MKMVRVMVLLCAAGIVASAQGQTRRVYVTAFGANGAPYTDLGPDDFIVKEGGKTHPIVSVGPASQQTMQVAILVDDAGSGMFRVPVARFIESLMGRAEFSIRAITGQTLKLVDFTTDRGYLSDAVAKLGARPTTYANEGTQLLDGITGASRDLLKRKSARPVIVALAVGGSDASQIQPEDALNDLRRSGAQLYVVTVVSGSLRATVTPARPGDMLNEGHALQAVLGDGPARSGGDREEISAIAGVDTGLQRFAAQLKSQLFIEYSLDGGKMSDKISIALKRTDLTLHAPTHVPNK